MFKDFAYPILCTDKYVETVDFYEDYLGYVPVYEKKGYVILKQESLGQSFLAIIDQNHERIPEEFRKPVQGMFLLHPVEDVCASFDELYMEGLTILGDIAHEEDGGSFMIKDPNNVIIRIWQAPPELYAPFDPDKRIFEAA